MCDFFGFVSILFKLTLTCEKSKSQRKMEIKRKRFEDVRKLFDKIGFEAIKTLGKGGYGEVFLAKNKSTGVLNAIKVMSRSKKKPYMEKYMTQEAQIMKRLNHPNIVKFIQFLETPDFYVLIMEYCEQGNLLSYQANLPGRVFQLNHALQIMVEVMKGLKWIHESTYVHRDLKSENILLKKEQINGGYLIKCKIADFGFARPIGKGNDATTYCGTQKYMAPEILGNKQYGISVDLWSLAVLFYFMLFGDYPFKGSDMSSDIFKKCNPFFDLEKVAPRKDILRYLPPEVHDFFKQSFVLDSKKRMTFSNILKHPLFAPFSKQFEQNEIFYRNFQKSEKYCKNENTRITQQDEPNQMEPEDDSRILLHKKEQLPNNLNHIATQLQQINYQIEKFQYLVECAQELYRNYTFILTYGERLIARFFLLRAFLFFTTPLMYTLQAKKMPQAMEELKMSQNTWNQCTQTEQYRKMVKRLQEKTLKYQFMYEDTYHLLQNNIKSIPIAGLENYIRLQITQKDFNEFKQTYRIVTSYFFKVFSNLENISSVLQRKMQLRIFCCHQINKIFGRNSIKKQFPYHFDWLQRKKISYSYSFDLNYFKQWVSEQDERRLAENLKLIYNNYYS